MARPIVDIDRMPRGGPDASCLDRLLETDRLEYLDRDDVDEDLKHRVIRALEWAGDFFGYTETFAQIAMDEVADVADPRILELGAGHGDGSGRSGRRPARDDSRDGCRRHRRARRAF